MILSRHVNGPGPGHGVWHLAEQGMFSWYQLKMFAERASVVDSDALHVLAGVLLWLAAALVLRQRLSSAFPLLVVLAAALFNEAVDLWVERWPDHALQYAESTKDVGLTIILPILLLLTIRFRPALFEGPAQARSRRRR